MTENNTMFIDFLHVKLDIHTVAAGGGSRLFFRDGLFIVGPDSVGASPGPVCYRKGCALLLVNIYLYKTNTFPIFLHNFSINLNNKGGNLAVTDANLVLGRIQPEYFPKIFGAQENQILDAQATRKTFEKLVDEELNPFLVKNDANRAGNSMTVEQAAMGFIEVANESMSRPIRALTQVIFKVSVVFRQ